MNAIDIHKDIEVTLRPSTMSQSTATKYLREAQVTHDSEPTPTLIEEGHRLIGEAILLAFGEGPFASVRRRASKRLIPMITVSGHVYELGMTVKHLRWVHHTL
jgi:hypothetical protein